MNKLMIKVPDCTMERLKMMAVENSSTMEILAGSAVDADAAGYFKGKDGDPAHEIPPGVKTRFGFKKKGVQGPLFMVWREWWVDGDVNFAAVLFNSDNWIKI